MPRILLIDLGPIVQTIFVLLRGSIIVCCLFFSSVHRITAGWPVDARTSLPSYRLGLG